MTTILKQSPVFLTLMLIGICGVLAMQNLAVVLPILLLGLIQFLAQGLEAIAGFGSSAIGVPIMAMITDLATAKAVAVLRVDRELNYSANARRSSACGGNGKQGDKSHSNGARKRMSCL